VVPREYKLHPWKVVGVVVEVSPLPSEGRLRIRVVVMKQGKVVVEGSTEVPLEMAQKDPGRLPGDLVTVFGLFGDQGVRATTVDIHGPVEEGYFVSRKELKQLKAQISKDLPKLLEGMVKEKLRKANRSLGVEGSSSSSSSAADSIGLVLPPVTWDDRSFAVKVDRLIYLEVIKRYVREGGVLPISEVRASEDRDDCWGSW